VCIYVLYIDKKRERKQKKSEKGPTAREDQCPSSVAARKRVRATGARKRRSPPQLTGLLLISGPRGRDLRGIIASAPSSWRPGLVVTSFIRPILDLPIPHRATPPPSSPTGSLIRAYISPSPFLLLFLRVSVWPRRSPFYLFLPSLPEHRITSLLRAYGGIFFAPVNGQTKFEHLLFAHPPRLLSPYGLYSSLQDPLRPTRAYYC